MDICELCLWKLSNTSALMAFQLDPKSLSLSTGRGVLGSGKDVLLCWPHEYNSAVENQRWAGALDWRGTNGWQSTKLACGFDDFAMNYAFDALYDFIPCGTDANDSKVVLFTANGKAAHLAKMRNFHASMTYIKHYPKQHNETLQRTLGVSSGLFSQQVVPTLLSIADNMSFLDWQLRLWEWNHTECFPERVTFVPDGFPVKIWAPSNRWLARLFRSGKYKEYVVKGHLTIAMGPGFPIRYTGPHIGVRHDARIFQEDRFLQARIKPWEYGLGDKAYVGQRQIITEWKGRNLSLEKQRFNKTVQHYRGRVEHIIGQVVDNRMALCTTWRGSFTLLAAVMKIAAHMVGLQERMKGPRYDVFGPWPVCPPHIAAQFP